MPRKQKLNLTGSTLFVSIASGHATGISVIGGVVIYDVSNRTQPKLLKKIITPGISENLVAVGNHVYVMDLSSMIDIIRIR